MKFTKEKIEQIQNKYENGEKIKRSEKIYYQNILGVRNKYLEYKYSNEEIEEKIKCKNSVLYFIDNYTNIKLRKYQREFIELYEKNRFIIWHCSRQIGSSLVRSLLYLHYILFNEDKAIGIIDFKLCNAREFLDKIKEIYRQLPFFLKPGVTKWDYSDIGFENGCRITTTSKNNPVFNFAIHVLDFNNFDHNYEKAYKSLIPCLLAIKDSRITIHTNNPKKSKIFWELMSNADKGENPFSMFRTYWWEVEGRDLEWKNEQIKMLGSKSAFLKEYELLIK